MSTSKHTVCRCSPIILHAIDPRLLTVDIKRHHMTFSVMNQLAPCFEYIVYWCSPVILHVMTKGMKVLTSDRSIDRSSRAVIGR